MTRARDIIERTSTVRRITGCSILCLVTLFVYSHRFVNAEVTPKWLGLMLLVGVAGIGWSVFSGAKQALPVRTFHCIFGVITAFAAMLAIYGLLQYFAQQKGMMQKTPVITLSQADNRTNNIIEKTRQGEPRVRPNGAALPP